MDAKAHWEKVYATKAPEAVSWYRPHLDTSLALIEKIGPASVIDVGGGQSTLVDDLLDRGHRKVAVLDVSPTAIEVTKRRLGAAADGVRWIVGDVTSTELPANAFDFWHDRAVFHFLRNGKDRAAYVGQILKTLALGGHLLISTFGPEGPRKCSGLDVIRYDANSLCEEFGEHFMLLESSTEMHRTPSGTTQQFLYGLFRVQ